MSRRRPKNLMKVTYRIPGRREAVGTLLEIVVSTLQKMGLGIDTHGLKLVLSEALTNALIYGSLQIKGGLRQREGSDVFWQLVAEREQDEQFYKKEIVLRVTCREDLVRFAIEDRGNGFDWESAMKSIDSQDSSDLKSHGRGLLIIRTYVEDLSWNDKGNQIRFSVVAHQKNRKKARKPAG